MEKGEGEGGMSQEEEEERIIPGGREEREPASRPVNISWHDPRTPPKQYDSNHVTTPSGPSSNRDPSPLHDLTNNMLSYSSQVTGSTAQGMQTDASLTISSWIPRSDNLRRPTSPTAISRIFKVAFLGETTVAHQLVCEPSSCTCSFRGLSPLASVYVHVCTEAANIPLLYESNPSSREEESRYCFFLWETHSTAIPPFHR